MNALSPSYPDTYRAAGAPDAWTSRAQIQSEDLAAAADKLSRLYENIEAEVCRLDESIARLSRSADELSGSQDDIAEAATLHRRMEAALRVLQGGVA